MSANSCRLSVVMTTYDNRAGLLRAVEPVLSESATDELIVVVDGSEDGSMELLRQVQARDSRLTPFFIRNRGTAGAEQYGVEQARGDVVLFLDDDVLLPPGVVSQHLAHHTAVSSSVLLGYMPVTLPKRRRQRDVYVYIYNEAYEHHVAIWERDPGAILTNFWGGHFSLHRADALAVGLTGKDERVRYYVDYIFGLRCRAAGLTGYFRRELKSEHFFRRGISAFVKDALIQGEDYVHLAEESPRQSPGQPPVEASPGLITITRHTVLAAMVGTMLRVLVALAGYGRLFSLQTRIALKLRRVYQLRGAWTAGAEGSGPLVRSRH